jgi:hypothetical protein
MAHFELHNGSTPNPLWRIVLVAFLAIGAFYLYSEHRAHLFGALPYLLLLLCPLMHLFMHHGQDKHDR